VKTDIILFLNIDGLVDKLLRSPLVSFLSLILNLPTFAYFFLLHFLGMCPAENRERRPTFLFPHPLIYLSVSHQADYFPDYTGGENYDAACDYLLHRFVSLNQSAATKQIYAHYMSTTDGQQLKCKCYYPCDRQSSRSPHAMTFTSFYAHPQE
jgi:hypothetical protein